MIWGGDTGHTRGEKGERKGRLPSNAQEIKLQSSSQPPGHKEGKVSCPVNFHFLGAPLLGHGGALLKPLQSKAGSQDVNLGAQPAATPSPGMAGIWGAASPSWVTLPPICRVWGTPCMPKGQGGLGYPWMLRPPPPPKAVGHGGPQGTDPPVRSEWSRGWDLEPEPLYGAVGKGDTGPPAVMLAQG